MLRAAALTSLLLCVATAAAQACSVPDLMDRRGPQVVVVGQIRSISTGVGGPDTLKGALSSIMRGDEARPTRTMDVAVGRALKGIVGQNVDVIYDPQDSTDLETVIGGGPILIAANRRGDGTLVTDSCMMLPMEHVFAPDGTKRPEIAADPKKGLLDKAASLLSDVAIKIQALGDPSSPEKVDSLLAMDELLTIAGDTERRVLMWEAMVEIVPAAETRAQLADAYLYAGRYAEARVAAAKAASEGSASIADILETSKLYLGEKGDPSRANFRNEQFDALDLSGTDLGGRDLSGMRARPLTASRTLMTGANLSRVRLGEARLDGADLSGANLTGASIGAVSMKGATLKGATLDASGIGGNAAEADLSGVSARDNMFLGEFSGANFSGASLVGTRFSDVNLDRATFEGTILDGVSFRKATLLGADLGKAVIGNVRWEDVTYDCMTRFPAGFDPAEAGLKKSATCGAGSADRKVTAPNPKASQVAPAPAEVRTRGRF